MSQTAPPTELEKVARSGAANLLGAGINGIAGLALTLIITNQLPKETTGQFMALSSVFIIVLAAIELGAPTGLAKWIPHYLALGRVGDVRSVLRTAILPVLGVSLVVAGLVWVFAPQLLDLMAGDDTQVSETAVLALRAIAVILPIAACYDLLLAASRGFGRIRPTIAVERLGRVPGQVLLVLLATASGSLISVSFGWAFPYIPAFFLIAWIVARSVIRAERKGVSGLGEIPAADTMRRRQASLTVNSAGEGATVTREFWTFTWPRGISRIFQSALQRLDVILVASILGFKEAAVYGAASRLVPVGLLGVEAVQQVLQPQLSKVLALGDLPNAQSLYRATTTWSIAMAWPIYCTGFVYAPEILRQLGPEGGTSYESGAWAMRILCLAMLVATASGPADMALLMSGRSQLSLANTGVALVANIVLNLTLIPVWGINGAAFAWAVAIVLTNIPPVLQLRYFAHLSPVSRGAITAAVLPVVLFGLGSGAALYLFGPDAIWSHLAWMVLMSAIYLVAIYWFRKVIQVDVVMASVRRKRS